jgi:hypothetical protein
VPAADHASIIQRREVLAAMRVLTGPDARR